MQRHLRIVEYPKSWIRYSEEVKLAENLSPHKLQHFLLT